MAQSLDVDDTRLVLLIIIISHIAVDLIIKNGYLVSVHTIRVVSPESNKFLQTTAYLHGAG